MAVADNIVGKGLVFPIELNSTGSPVLKTGFDLINSSIKIILSWPFKHKIFLSEFGSRLAAILEEPNDDLLRGLVEHFTYEALLRWERRIEVLEVVAERRSPDSLDVLITYRIKNSGLEDTFVFPFYTKQIY